jgi:chloramphenicol-sensitive protein RarD
VHDSSTPTPSSRELIAGAGAFFLWGILPLYWKSLSEIPPTTIIAHRTLWSLVMLWSLLALQGRAISTFCELRRPRVVLWHLLSGFLLADNWLLYVWATLNGHIIEGAQGYYLNPFFNMLFGFLLFGERQNRLQQASIAIALLGVVMQFQGQQGFPWIAIALALSFSLYAVVRKKSPLESLPALCVETLLLVPIAIIWLCVQTPTIIDSLQTVNATTILLICTGIATATPLLLFGFAAKNISLTTLGILQFIGPSIQFLIGWLYYHEPMTLHRTFAFILIWGAIAIYLYSLRNISRTPSRKKEAY